MIESLIALLALSLMEIVLGIDNIVFISILTSKLPLAQQSAGRKLGLLLALVTRIMLLSLVFWMAHLTISIFTLSDFLPIESFKSYFIEDLPKHAAAAELPVGTHEPPRDVTSSQTPVIAEAATDDLPHAVFDQHAWEEFDNVTLRDLILLAGGLFLIYNSVREIHSAVEGEHSEHLIKQPSFYGVLFQIAMMDIIFSIDSVITAVGMAEELWVMIAAVIVAVGVMIWFADRVGKFVDDNPTIKMLALNFLLLIGVMLVAEGIGTPISKAYVYFAMAFSLLVEFLNMRTGKRLTDVPATSIS